MLQKLPRKPNVLSSEVTPDTLQDDGQRYPAILNLTRLLAHQTARDFMAGVGKIEQREGGSQ